MLKFIKHVSVILIISVLASTTSFAAASQDSILRENTILILEADPDNMDEYVGGHYDSFLQMVFAEEMIYYWGDDDALLEKAQNVMDYIADYLSTHKLTLVLAGMEEYDYLDPDGGFIFEISEDNFKKNIETPYLLENSEIIEVSGHKIYNPEAIDGSFAYLDGYLIFAMSDSFPTFLIQQYYNDCTTDCLPALEENADFIKTKNSLLPNSALDMYITNIDFLTENGIDEEFLEDMFFTTFISGIQTEGISIEQTSDGFKMKIYLALDPVKMAEIGMDLSNLGTPTLYKYMPNDDILLFADGTNAPNSALIQSMPDYGDALYELSEGGDVDAELIINSLDHELAYAVQDSGELFPTLTVMAKLGTEKDSVKTELNKFADFIWEEMKLDADQITSENKILYTEEEEGLQLEITKGSVTIENSELVQFTIKIILNNTKNPYAIKLDENLVTFKVTLGVIDNILLFSTNKNIQYNFKEGLGDNSTISSLLSQKPNSISYIDTKNINNYLQNFLTIIQEGISDEFYNATETKTYLDSLFSNFGTIKGVSFENSSSVESTMDIEMDLEKFVEFMTMALMEDNAPQDDIDTILNSQRDYTDVENTTWYGEEVHYLTAKGVVSGYDDETYKPEQSINRAEFTKIIVEALEKEGYLEILYWSYLDEFNDVDSYSWYSDYLNTAFENYIISGYGDGTFRPDNPISRAEVAQIIANVIDKFDIQIEDKLTDVNPDNIFVDIYGNEWYVEGVKRVYEYKIMEGTTPSTFEPNREINRAESAVVIRNLIEIL